MTRAILFAALLSLTGCSNEIDEAPQATVTDPAPAPAPPPPPPAGESVELKADNTTGKIEFVGAKITDSHPGGFNTFSGTATLQGDALVATKFEIEMDSVFTDSDRLTGHLKNADFFDVPTFPKATFESSAITAGSDVEGATHTVTGTLDFHGVSKALSFPATITVADGSAKATAEFSLMRKDWGVAYAGKPDDLIKDAVLIKLDLSFNG